MNEIQNKEIYQGLNKLYADVSEILAMPGNGHIQR